MSNSTTISSGSVQFAAEYRFMNIKTFLIIHNTLGYVVVVKEGEMHQDWCPCCMDQTTRDGIVRLVRQAAGTGEIVGRVKWVQFHHGFFGQDWIFGSEASLFEEGLDGPQIPEHLRARAIEMARSAETQSPKS